MNANFWPIIVPAVFLVGISGCVSAPTLDANKIRAWSKSLESEYPERNAVIAHYQKGGFEVFYLAAQHTVDLGSDTLNLVAELFKRFEFNVLLIEPFPYSYGESPQWFVDDAEKGKNNKFIPGGESSLAAILASQKNIPFFGGEPSHKDMYLGLKDRGYSDEDIFGFYVVRQIPSWIRDKEDTEGLLERKAPQFLSFYYQAFDSATRPTLPDITKWYRTKLGRELGPDVSNEEVAPLSDGNLLTQKISSDVGNIRDHFTLALIEKMLKEHKRIAVIYGASHFVTLRKSLDSGLGTPTFIEDVTRLVIH